MKNTKHTQAGFAALLVVLLVVAVGAGGSVAYMKVKSAQDHKAEVAKQEQLAKDADAAKKLAEQKKQDALKAAAEKAKTTAVKKVASQTPTPTSPKPTSNATALKSGDCVLTKITVYVSNKNGTSGSYTPPERWNPTKNFAYGDSISGSCYWNSSLPSYVVINDLYLKMADLSSTKP